VLLHDCQQLIREFFPLLSVAASQLYISVPAFLPENIELLNTYNQQFQNSVKILHHGNRPQHWDACLWTLEHTARVTAAVFSPDSKYIVSAIDNTAQFWDPLDGTHIETLQVHSESGQCYCVIAFSHDGAYFVTGSYDCTVKLWNAHTNQLLFTIQAKDKVNSISLSPKGDIIVYGTLSEHVNLWKPWERLVVIARDPFYRLIGHTARVLSVAFSPDGAHIVSGSWDTLVIIWNTNTQNIVHKLKGHTQAVLAVGYSHNGTQIVTGSLDKTICLWNSKTGSLMRQLKGHQLGLFSVSFSPNDKYIVSGSSDKTIRLWSASNGTHLKTFVGHSDVVSSVAFSKNGAQIVSASADRTVKVWDVFGHSYDIPMRKGGKIHALTVSNNGAYIASVLSNHQIDLYSALSGALLKTFKGHSECVNCVVFSADNQLVSSGSSDMSIRVWDVLTGTCLQVIKGHLGAVHSVKFFANNINIISGSKDETVQCWNARTGKHLQSFIGHSESVSCVALSSDDLHIASASHDRTVQMWNVNNGNHVRTLHGHSDTVYQVTFSPTNTILASGSSDETIWLTDVMSGTTLNIINLNVTIDSHMYFSWDQQFIVTGSHLVPTGLPVPNSRSTNAYDYQQFASHYLKNGWIVAFGTQQRICWIPQAYQGLLVSTATGAALHTSSGTIIILDFTNMQMPTHNTR